ncbi:MAG: hypothetical protein ACJ8AT_08995 [Hyalangium sp.]|uniref:hypothetical protein n=1 Tax=Hyalangium sp. TaxID=2028555 RepID=UPI00389AABED
MRVGIICEGSTDFAVIEALALDLLPADECVQLHPDFDRLRSTGDPAHAPGWQGVRTFLQTSGPALALPVYDVIVIQIDASIRKLKELRLPRTDDVGPVSLEPLYEHVASWATGGLPASAVITLPREELEAWLVAANTNVKDVEALEDPAGELVSHGLIGIRKNKPDKDAQIYRKLVVPLVRLARDPKKVRKVPELERFVGKLRIRAREVRSEK